MMYRHLIDKYGEVHSDSEQTDDGAALWNRLSRAPDLESKIVPHGQPGRSAIAKRGRLGKSEREKTLTEVSSVAVFDPRGRLLLGRRSDSKKWTLPGGHAEPNEDPDDCARRELKEEAGIDLPYDRFTFLGTGRVNGVVVCSYAVYLKPAEVRQAPHGRDDPDEECSEWKFFSAKDGLPQEVRDELHAKRNVTLALAGLGSPEGIDFGEGLAVASESNRVLVVPKGGGSAPKRGNDLKKSGGSKLYHGSRTGLTGSTLRAGACLTSSPDTARHYAGDGGRVYEVGLKLPPVASERQVRQALTDEGVEVGEHLFETVDDHVPLLGEHYDACEYQDMDPNGVTHRCIRLLTDVEPHLLQEVGDLNKSEVDELLQHPDPLERSIALRLQGVSQHHLIRALHDPHPDVRATAARHPGVDAHVLLGFMAAPSAARAEQLQLLRDHPAVTSDHVRALVGFVARDPNGEAPETVRTLAQNPLLDEDSVRVLWDLGDQGTRMLLVGHPACPPDLREGVVQDELRQPLGASTAALAIEALAHPLAAQLRAGVLRSGRMELVSALAGAPDLQPELIDEVLGYGRIPTEPDTWADVRVKMLSGTNVTKQHLDTALEDRHQTVRAAVFSSPSPELSRAHVLRAIARGEPDLATVALRSRVGGLP
jgi:8-oxo-dGTP pyrophosphatase MutT (NUDIX family)